MNRIYEYLDNFIDYVNSHSERYYAVAVPAYRPEQIDLPIENCITTFCCESYEFKKVYNDNTGMTTETESLAISISCYVSFNNSALASQNICGNILKDLKEYFPAITSYKLGKIESDSDARAFVTNGMIYLDFKAEH